MIIVDIDTMKLRSAVGTAQQTNDSISEALSLLNQVVIHNDWQCKERYKINENTMANRQKAQEIQNNTSSFYQAIKQASERFDEREQSIQHWTNQVDGPISEIVNVVPGGISGIAGGIADSLPNGIAGGIVDGLPDGIAGGVGAPIVARFDNIKSSLEE